MAYYNRFKDYNFDASENSDEVKSQRKSLRNVLWLIALYTFFWIFTSNWAERADTFLNGLNLCEYVNWCSYFHFEMPSINSFGRLDFVFSLLAIYFVLPLVGDIIFDNHRFVTPWKSLLIYVVYSIVTFKFIKCLVSDKAFWDVYCSFLTVFFLELIRYNKYWRPDFAKIFNTIGIWCKIKFVDIKWTFSSIYSKLIKERG